MTIAHATSSANGVGSTTVTPGLAAGMATGDGIVVVIVTKPSTATIAVPANWTLIGTNTGGAGTDGVGTGPTRVGAYFREKTAAWSSPPAFTVTSGNSTAAASYRFTKSAAAIWDTFNRNSSYNGTTAGTALNNTPATLDLMPGDYICTALSNHDDAPTWSAESYSASGITFGTLTEFADNIATTTGNDVGGAFWGAPITAGTGTVGIQQLATASAASTGAIVMVRLRELYPRKSRLVSNVALQHSHTW